MEREWDVDWIYGDDAVYAKLAEGPQLCQVLNEDISPQTLFNISRRYYPFYIKLDGKDRLIILPCAVKDKLRPDEPNSGVRQLFGRPASDYADIEIFDDPIEVDGIPYLPFRSDLDIEHIDKHRPVYDIQSVNGQDCILCTYYDHENCEKPEGGVISQFQVEIGGQK